MPLSQPAPIPFPHRKALDEQKRDFTAEGSPPPGRVAKALPATPGREVKPVSRKPLAVPGGHAHRSPSEAERG